MDSVKAQKLQAMQSYKKARFIYHLVVYSLTAVLSFLFYLYLFCVPSMSHLLFDFLPSIYSFFLSPKFLFILGNIIVFILVGESKLLGGSSSSPATDIYDEYVENRSRSLRQQKSAVLECKKKDGNNYYYYLDHDEKRSIMRRHCSLNNIRSLEGKKKKKMGMVLGQSLKRPVSFETLHEVQYENYKLEKEERSKERVSQSLTRPQSLGRLNNMHEENDPIIHNKMSLEEKRKEMEQSMDELNQRVEEFIARVNKQRMLEARELDSNID